jgi:hypothetical protein
MEIHPLAHEVAVQDAPQLIALQSRAHESKEQPVGVGRQLSATAARSTDAQLSGTALLKSNASVVTLPKVYGRDATAVHTVALS